MHAPPLPLPSSRVGGRRWSAGVVAGFAVLLGLLPSRGSPHAEPATVYQLALPEPGGDLARPRHAGRALLETTALLLGGTVWYWRSVDLNARDWELRWDAESWKRKLTFDAVRFDQNAFYTNAEGHPRAGYGHYMVGRGNGLTVGESTGLTLASSVVWEYLVEWKEIPSLNDMVVNTVAGLAIGEPFYQLGEFFRRSRPTLLYRGLAAAASPVAATNDWIDGRRRATEATDRFGFTRAMAHRFELSAGFNQHTFDPQRLDLVRRGAALGLDSELITLPGYGRPGRISTFVDAGAWTSIAARLDVGSAPILAGALLTRTSVLGHYAQDLRRSPDGRVTGHGLLLGLGSAFDYESVGRPGAADYLAVMNVIGPVFDLVSQSGGLRLRWTGELYLDFAMVHSIAFEGRRLEMTDDVFRPARYGGRVPSVLGAQGYYFALGLTAGSGLALEYWGWDAGVGVRADHFDSIAGLDRFREEITDEIDLVDRRVVARAWLGVRPWGRQPRLSAGLEWRWRRGVAEELARAHLDLRVGVATSIVF